MDKIKLYAKCFKKAFIKSFARMSKKGGAIGKAMYFAIVLPVLLTVDFLVNSFDQAVTHRKLSRAFAGLMIAVMVFTSIGITSVLAEESEGDAAVATEEVQEAEPEAAVAETPELAEEMNSVAEAVEVVEEIAVTPEEVPAEETPAEETPVEETPVEEVVAEEVREEEPVDEAEVEVEAEAAPEALEETEEEIEEETDVVFVQSTTVDGVTISVTADAGVFPEGAYLVARRATVEEQAVAEQAIDAAGGAVNVAERYSFDISVYDAAGNEIQPDTSKGSVKVSFALAKVNDASVEADIYHISDNAEAQQLNSVTVGDQIEAETTGFSIYTVEFTYNDLMYVMPGDSMVRLTEILEYLGIEGNIVSASSSNEALFTVGIFREEWQVRTVQSFTTEETLTVTTDMGTYEIVVTDPVASGGSLVFDDNYGKSGETLIAAVLGQGLSASNVVKQGTVYTFSNGMADTGIESGIILDCSGSSEQKMTTDPDLDALVSANGGTYAGSYRDQQNNSSKLEFEMVASGKLLNFNYAFASSEFDQGPSYNDAFGLFVSVNDGPYENIAKITKADGSLVDVTIKNLRAGLSGTEMDNGTAQNPDVGTHTLFTYRTYNINGYGLNGVSNVFNAQKAVNVGDKVKIKFVVCNVGDDGVPSYVFIEGGSLSFDAPNSNVNYATEELKGLDAEATYVITCDDVEYVFTATQDGTIPLIGKDNNDKDYNFLGKEISIVRKGDDTTEDSEAQEVSIASRPEAVEADTNGYDTTGDAAKPADIGNDAIATDVDGITLHIDKDDETKMAQQYRVYDEDGNEIEGFDWVEPNKDGTVVFTGLEENTNYTIRARIAATKSAPASLPTTGISVTTLGTIAVSIPEETEISYDGTNHGFDIGVEDDDVVITYSFDPESEYTTGKPEFTHAGTYTVYYKVQKPGCQTGYGSYTVTIDKSEKDDEELEETLEIALGEEVEENRLDFDAYLPEGATIADVSFEGDILDYIEGVSIEGREVVLDMPEYEFGTEGYITLTVQSPDYEEYQIRIPLMTTLYVEPVIEVVEELVPEVIEVIVEQVLHVASQEDVMMPNTTELVSEEAEDVYSENPEDAEVVDEYTEPEVVRDVVNVAEVVTPFAAGVAVVEEVGEVIAEVAGDVAGLEVTQAVAEIGIGNIVDRGDIWTEVSDETKVKLLDKLDATGGEIVRVSDSTTMDTGADTEKMPVKETPIALVMGEGAVVVTMELTDATRSTAALADAKEVANSILNEEQRQAVANGSILEIKVEIKPLNDEVIPELDRWVITDGAAAYAETNPNLAMGDYIDISMYFRVDDADWEQITETEEFLIVIDIPEAYRGLSDTYYIMRAHEGKSTLLEDLDDDPNTITISTGQFSTYALMFDQAPTSMQDLSAYKVAVIHNRIPGYWWIFILSVIGLTMVYARRKMEEE